MKKELLEKITDHLLTDIKPSTYMKSIEDDLWGTPLQINNELKTVEQSPKSHPEGNGYMMLEKRRQQKRIAKETTHHIIMIKLAKK